MGRKPEVTLDWQLCSRTRMSADTGVRFKRAAALRSGMHIDEPHCLASPKATGDDAAAVASRIEAAVSQILFTEPVLIVIQTWRDGYWPEYDVFDKRWKQLGTARRSPATGIKRVVNQQDEGPLRVFDMSGTLLLTTDPTRPHRRPATFLADAAGDEVGWLIRMAGILRPRFDLEHRGSRVGSIDVADRRQRVVHVRDGAGALVADIRTFDREAPFEVPDGKDGYYLTRYEEMPDPLRTLVVGSSIIFQSVVSSETGESTLWITTPGIPALVDRLKGKRR